MAIKSGDDDDAPFPMRYGVLLACDKIAQAFMFLITELPQVTQKGAREMSAHKVQFASDSASRGVRNALAFLTKALQDLHDGIAHPSGLLNQVATHGHEPGDNRHAEVQLRQLLRGVHQMLAMHSSFTAFVAEDLGPSTSHQRVQPLSDINTASDVVLSQLTMISDKVNQRIQQLSRPRNPAACLPCPPVVVEAVQPPPPVPQARKAGRVTKRQKRNE